MPPAPALRQYRRTSFSPALPQVVAQSCYKFFRRNAKRLTHSQHREYRYRASGLDHLPVAHTEAKGDHVLLGQLTLHPVGPDSVAQGAEVPGVTFRDLSAGTHSSKAGSSRARTPRTKLRIGWCSISICATISALQVLISGDRKSTRLNSSHRCISY